MADKEKQIEEMYNDFLAYKFTIPIDKFSYRGAFEHLEKQGYRKINENEVVISKEEYRKLKLKRKNAMAMETARKVCEHIENDNKKIRKETAEKIFNAIKSKNQYEYFSYDDDKYCVSSDSIEKLAKEFGVDLGEDK